jgi:hypothetical protein
MKNFLTERNKVNHALILSKIFKNNKYCRVNSKINKEKRLFFSTYNSLSLGFLIDKCKRKRRLVRITTSISWSLYPFTCSFYSIFSLVFFFSLSLTKFFFIRRVANDVSSACFLKDEDQGSKRIY